LINALFYFSKIVGVLSTPTNIIEPEKVNPLILSSTFHYEFVFIHPFSDGNGITARLWQIAILAHWKDLFKYIPIESIIRKHQEEYYSAIQNCNNVGNSNEFIEFMLEIIDEAVDGMILNQQETTQEKIINLIKKNPSITQVEMVKTLDLTRDGISYNIKALKEKGIIERVGSTKNGIWKINVEEVVVYKFT
jgi:Fic family protein